MKRMLKIWALCLIVGIGIFSFLITGAEAQTYTTSPNYTSSRTENRTGTWEFFLPLTYSPSSDWSGPGGSSLDLDAAWGFGFGAGYNFNEHFQLNGLFSWSARNYAATIINTDGKPRQYGNTLYTSTFALNGVYYFMKGKISPFLSAGVGMTYIDTSIQTAPGSTTCWWDPVVRLRLQQQRPDQDRERSELQCRRRRQVRPLPAVQPATEL